VTDIFFSYSSVDRERVRPIRDALVAQDFEVFWDQEVPSGLDWESWIRQHLAKSKCAVVFWSTASVASKHVQHEARIADEQSKLIPVLLEPLTTHQFPLGLHAREAANLSNWNGDQDNEEWSNLWRQCEAKLTPLWIRKRIEEKDAQLVGERARRQVAERRDQAQQAEIVKRAETQQELERARDSALDEIAALKGTVEELARTRSEAKAREADTFIEVAALKATVDTVSRARSDAEQRLSKVRQIKSKQIVRSISPFVIAAAVATVGIWTYQLIWAAPQPLPAVITADAEAKLQAAEAEQQRLRDDLRRQTKAAGDAEAKLKAAEAEQQRLASLKEKEQAAAAAEVKLRSAVSEQLEQALRTGPAPSVPTVGAWTGEIAQVGSQVPYKLEIALGPTGGETKYPDLDCIGKLTRVGSSRPYAFFVEVITKGSADKGGRCPDGTITAAQQGDYVVLGWFGYIQGTTVVAYGTLKKK
jgi:TIR domain